MSDKQYTMEEFNKLTSDRAQIELAFLDYVKQLFTEEELDEICAGSQWFGNLWEKTTERLNKIYRNRLVK